MPAKMSSLTIGPVSHWMPARISLLAAGPVSHWMLVRTLVFGRLPLTRIEKMMPMISKLTVTTCRPVFHWMPLAPLEMVLLLWSPSASLKTLKNYLPLLPVDPTLIFRREIRFYLAQPFELYRKEAPFVPT
jgi:hypothetical protein